MEKNDKIIGLSDEQAQELASRGLSNGPQKKMTRSAHTIVLRNLFTVFNLVNCVIFAALLYVGSLKNSLFMIAVVSNTLIGIIQELRSKRITDRLTIVHQSKIKVLRNGRLVELPVSQIVKGDVLALENGSQVPNDCVMLSGTCEVNESLLTGESDSVEKAPGDKLLSGSFLIGGKCFCRITAVGSENYADKLLSGIKYVKTSRSQIVVFLDKLIGVITICIIPLCALLFYSQLIRDPSVREAVEHTSAAIIGMIPEGLVLLCTTVFAFGVVRLAHRNVLSQDLYSLEALARADVLCVDKTGTVTTGEMEVVKAVPAKGNGAEELKGYLEAFCALSPDSNSTMKAIRARFAAGREDLTASAVCPFSSQRKWSAVEADGIGTLVMGSSEIIFGKETECTDDEISFRCVVIAKTDEHLHGRELPQGLECIGKILLRETVREGIGETFEYFRSQGVTVKMISGDSPETVRRLCSGLYNENCVCTDLSKDGCDISELAETTDIFGRATPEQKLEIVAALRKNGHIVAMVGDGVNDVMAMKESDCSAAPANGSDAARNVAQLVMLDSDFRSLPEVVSEGRRSINNLQNSSSLFLSKTIFSAVMAVVFTCLGRAYPFAPIQMTLISVLTIGFPSFVLSFLKDNKPVRGSLIRNILINAVPAALSNIICVLTSVMLAPSLGISGEELSTVCVLVLAVTGIILIAKIYKPLYGIKPAVIAAAAAGFAPAFIFFRSFFGLSPFLGSAGRYMVIIPIFDAVLLCILLRMFSLIGKIKRIET